MATLPYPLPPVFLDELENFIGDNLGAIESVFEHYKIDENVTPDHLLLAGFTHPKFAGDIDHAIEYFEGPDTVFNLSDRQKNRRAKAGDLLKKGLGLLQNAGDAAGVAQTFLNKDKDKSPPNGGGGGNGGGDGTPPPAAKSSFLTPSVQIALAVLAGLILLFIGIKVIKK